MHCFGVFSHPPNNGIDGLFMPFPSDKTHLLLFHGEHLILLHLCVSPLAPNTAALFLKFITSSTLIMSHIYIINKFYNVVLLKALCHLKEDQIKPIWKKVKMKCCMSFVIPVWKHSLFTRDGLCMLHLDFTEKTFIDFNNANQLAFIQPWSYVSKHVPGKKTMESIYQRNLW